MASIYDLSTTAASNTTIDGTDVSGSTGKVKDGDNAMRSLGAFDAQFVDDLGAVNTVAGTADVITVALASAITAYATGQIFRFIAGAANTTNVTMNVNSIGAKAVRKISGGTDVALVAGDLVAGETYTLIYRATANAAAGAWVIVGVPNLSSYLTTTAAAATYVPLAGTGQTLLAFFPTDNEPPSSNYATFDVRNGHPILTFPDAVVYVAIFSGVMPKRYSGNGLTVLINWMNSGTSTNKCCLSATLERMDVGTTDLDADSFGTQVIDTTGIAANATSGIQSQTSIALTTGANMDSVVAGDAFRLKITRETGQANDTNTGDLQIVSIEIRET